MIAKNKKLFCTSSAARVVVIVNKFTKLFENFINELQKFDLISKQFKVVTNFNAKLHLIYNCCVVPPHCGGTTAECLSKIFKNF